MPRRGKHVTQPTGTERKKSSIVTGSNLGVRRAGHGFRRSHGRSNEVSMELRNDEIAQSGAVQVAGQRTYRKSSVIGCRVAPLQYIRLIGCPSARNDNQQEQQPLYS